jgi:hypothetical protein
MEKQTIFSNAQGADRFTGCLMAEAYFFSGGEHHET